MKKVEFTIDASVKDILQLLLEFDLDNLNIQELDPTFGPPEVEDES